MTAKSEAVYGLRSPDSRLVDVAGIVSEVDAADGIMLVGNIAGKHADLKVSDSVPITGPQPAFKLCPEGKFHALIEKITGLAFDFPVCVQVYFTTAGQGLGIVQFQVRSPLRRMLEGVAEG